MSNAYGISADVEKTIRQRDKDCVYCHVPMVFPSTSEGERKRCATIEHFDNDGPLNQEWNLGICCWACNSSKGSSRLVDWFGSGYCRERGINASSVAEPVKVFLNRR